MMADVDEKLTFAIFCCFCFSILCTFLYINSRYCYVDCIARTWQRQLHIKQSTNILEVYSFTLSSLPFAL